MLNLRVAPLWSVNSLPTPLLVSGGESGGSFLSGLVQQLAFVQQSQPSETRLMTGHPRAENGAPTIEIANAITSRTGPALFIRIVAEFIIGEDTALSFSLPKRAGYLSRILSGSC